MPSMRATTRTCSSTRSWCASRGPCSARRRDSCSSTPMPGGAATTCRGPREGDSRARQPEWPDGIGRLWGRVDAPAELVQDYLALVRGVRPEPGQPVRRAPLLSRVAPHRAPASRGRRTGWSSGRSTRRSAPRCRSEFAGERRVVGARGGRLRGHEGLPSARRRGGPWSSSTRPSRPPGSGRRSRRRSPSGLGRFPEGTYAVWYPLTGRARIGRLPRTARRRRGALASRPS